MSVRVEIKRVADVNPGAEIRNYTEPASLRIRRWCSACDQSGDSVDAPSLKGGGREWRTSCAWVPHPRGKRVGSDTRHVVPAMTLTAVSHRPEQQQSRSTAPPPSFINHAWTPSSRSCPRRCAPDSLRTRQARDQERARDRDGRYGSREGVYVSVDVGALAARAVRFICKAVRCICTVIMRRKGVVASLHHVCQGAVESNDTQHRATSRPSP